MATELIFLLDRSGSMGTPTSLVTRTINDVNELINKYREVPNAYMSLIQFDDKYEPNYLHRKIQDVNLLNTDTYQPRGSTALYDAICKTIDDAGVRFKSLPEADRENLNVVFAVFTDGQENMSSEFKDPEQVKRRIKHQQDKYNWQFVFMGADEQGILSAGRLGFSAQNTVKMSNNDYGRQYTMSNFADKLGAYGVRGATGPAGSAGANLLAWSNEEKVESNK